LLPLAEPTQDELWAIAESPKLSTPVRRRALTKLARVILSEAEKTRWEKCDDSLTAASAVDAIVSDLNTQMQELWRTYLELESADLATVRDPARPLDERKSACRRLYPYGTDPEAIEVRSWRAHFEMEDLGEVDSWLAEQESSPA
jgi:hypothetical protein